MDNLPLLSDSSDEDTKVLNKRKAKNLNYGPIQKGAASPHNRKHKQPKSTEKIPDKTKQNLNDQIFYEKSFQKRNKTIEMDTNQNIRNLVETTVVVENLTIKGLGDINLPFCCP